MNWWEAPVIQGYKWSFAAFWTHSGIDLGMPYGTTLTTPVNGKVIGAGCYPWGGQVDILTTLSDGSQYVLSFLHLSQIAGQLGMHIGEQISAGTTIGFSGGTRNGVCPTGAKYSTVAHLHFELTYGTTAPYSGAGGHYKPSDPPFLPTSNGANQSRHPVDPGKLLDEIKAGNGQAASGNSGGAGGDNLSGNTPGQKSHSILTSVPGFLGICEALDAIEQFEAFDPSGSSSSKIGVGPVQVSVPNPLDTFGYSVRWTGRNLLVIVVRLLIMVLGWALLLLLVWGLIAANRWVGEAGELAAAAAIGAV